MESATPIVKYSRAKVLVKLIIHAVAIAAITLLLGVIPGIIFSQESQGGSAMGILWVSIVLIFTIYFTSSSKVLGFDVVAKQGGLPYKILLTLLSLVISVVVTVFYIVSSIGAGIGSAL